MKLQKLLEGILDDSQYAYQKMLHLRTVLTLNSQAAYLANTCRLPLGTFLAKLGLTHFPLIRKYFLRYHSIGIPPLYLIIQCTVP